MGQTKISRKGALDAAKAGGEAFRAGKNEFEVPRIEGDPVADEFYGYYWLRGFRAAAQA